MIYEYLYIIVMTIKINFINFFEANSIIGKYQPTIQRYILKSL